VNTRNQSSEYFFERREHARHSNSFELPVREKDVISRIIRRNMDRGRGSRGLRRGAGRAFTSLKSTRTLQKRHIPAVIASQSVTERRARVEGLLADLPSFVEAGTRRHLDFRRAYEQDRDDGEQDHCTRSGDDVDQGGEDGTGGSEVEYLGERAAEVLGRVLFDAVDAQACRANDLPRTTNVELVEAILELAAAFGEDGVREITEWESAWEGFALDNAAQTGSLECVELLIRFGARVNVGDNGRRLDGYPLFAAANNGHGDICYALVKAGADPYCETFGKDKTAIHAAVTNAGSGSSFRGFARANVDFSVPQKNGWVALDAVMEDDTLRQIWEEYSGTMTKSAAKI
jgi:Ankyrin repeats (3 copies)